MTKLFFWQNQDYLRGKLTSLLTKAQKSGLLDESSRVMIENILSMPQILVREIMIPRTQIIAVSAEDSPAEILQEIVNSGYSRIPVYRGSIDNIIGILNVKDLIGHCGKPLSIKDILSLLSRPYYIPETKNAYLLFAEMKNIKKHLAVVIDEYGGTSGLVTLEDLLEEIVGDINDEHDTADSDGMVHTTEGAIIIDGSTDIEKIEELLHIHLEKGRYETLGGMILNTIRRIPHNGEAFTIEGLDVVIESADDRSIKRVRIKNASDPRSHHPQKQE